MRPRRLPSHSLARASCTRSSAAPWSPTSSTARRRNAECRLLMKSVRSSPTSLSFVAYSLLDANRAETDALRSENSLPASSRDTPGQPWDATRAAASRLGQSELSRSKGHWDRSRSGPKQSPTALGRPQPGRPRSATRGVQGRERRPHRSSPQNARAEFSSGTDRSSVTSAPTGSRPAHLRRGPCVGVPHYSTPVHVPMSR
jgi:hypothetical protein